MLWTMYCPDQISVPGLDSEAPDLAELQ